jgi:Aromatic acid exporter family member 1
VGRLATTRDRVVTRARDDLRRLVHPGRTPGLRTAKTVVAAVLAFALAEALHTSSSPILAPLTALLVVQLTMYETLVAGWERIVSVVAGVLLAALFAGFLGLTWWSLGLIVAVSILAGRILRLGDHLMEVPISAMLILAVGGNEQSAVGRVVETLVGAAVGVAVNLLIAPPLYIQPASDALAELAEHMARYAEELGAALRGSWSRGAAEAELTRARRLRDDVARADRHLLRTERSARLNPRGGQARALEPRLRSTLDALERAQVGLRNLSRAVLDRTFFVPEDEADRPYPPEARAALADVLDAVAVGLRSAAGSPAHAGLPPPGPEVADAVTTLDRRRDQLAALLLVDPAVDPAAWAQHGALLDAVDRLRVEVRSALSPPAPPALRAPLAERHRRAVRRALRGARRPPTGGRRRGT